MNYVTIAGKLWKDPEFFILPSGTKKTTLSIYTKDYKTKKADGAKFASTLWWEAYFYGDRFVGVLPFLKKGAGIIVAGDLLTPRVSAKPGLEPIARLGIDVQALNLPPRSTAINNGEHNFGESNTGDPELLEEIPF